MNKSKAPKAQHPENLIPMEDEGKQNFVARCMNNAQMQKDYGENQRQTQCNLIWSDHMQPDISEITMFGEVGGEVTAQALINQLEMIEGEKDIDINLFSGGGDLFEAAAIFSVLQRRREKGRVRIFVHGLAASAGAFIAVAGDELIMEQGAMLMIHNAWTIAVGNKDDLRDTADLIEKQQRAMVNALANKSGKDVEEIEALLDAETWMTAAEAIEMGFADGVFEVPESDRVAASIDKKVAADYNFKKIPESVKVTGKQKQTKQKSEPMNNAILKACGLTENADNSDVLAFITNLKAEKDTLKQDIQDKDETLNALKAKVDSLQESTKAQQVESLIDDVLDSVDGKLGKEDSEGLRRRAQRCVEESDEDRKADIKEDMKIFAQAKAVKTGSDGTGKQPPINSSKTSANSGEETGGAAVGYENKLLARIEQIQQENPEMDFSKAKAKAERLLRDEDMKAKGITPQPHAGAN